MGILYLDEAGNTGLRDTNQPLLIYGGPYIEPSTWKKLNDDLILIQRKYLGIIASRFQSGLRAENFLAEVGTNVNFLTDFHFHAKNIINRTALWSKLDETERFNVLEDIIDIIIKHDITFYIGVLDKAVYQSTISLKNNNMGEYRHLHEQFLSFIESDTSEHAQIITVIDDGDAGEKEILKDCLSSSNLNKFFGELVCGKHKDYPLLQVADIGVWVFQAFHRLGSNRSDDYAQSVRNLYNKLQRVLKIKQC